MERGRRYVVRSVRDAVLTAAGATCGPSGESARSRISRRCAAGIPARAEILYNAIRQARSEPTLCVCDAREGRESVCVDWRLCANAVVILESGSGAAAEPHEQRVRALVGGCGIRSAIAVEVGCGT